MVNGPIMSIACLNGCGKIGVWRGVCITCHNRQSIDIRNGLTTDAELVSKGLRNPASKKVYYKDQRFGSDK